MTEQEAEWNCRLLEKQWARAGIGTQWGIGGFRYRDDHKNRMMKMPPPEYLSEPRKPSALTRQEGGDHYQGYAISPAMFCQKNGIGFIEGCVVKYVCRYKSKNGAEDIKKAIHYLQMLLEIEYPETPTP